MIGLNMTMPEDCAECPCSHWFLKGRFEGMLTCEALEAIYPGQEEGSYLVSERSRPDYCPMTEIYIAYDPR